MKPQSKLFLCALFFLTAGLVFSQPAPAPAKADKALKSLGLTEEQVTQVNSVMEKARTAAKVQRAALAVLEAQIRQALVVSSPDLKAANAMVDQKTALLASLEKQKLAEGVQLRQIVGDKVFDQARKFLGKPVKHTKAAKASKASKAAKADKIKPRRQP